MPENFYFKFGGCDLFGSCPAKWRDSSNITSSMYKRILWLHLTANLF
jgi:hypothetical protein